MINSISLLKDSMEYISKNDSVQNTDFDKELQNTLNCMNILDDTSENILSPPASNIQELLFEMNLRTSFSPDSKVNPVQTPLDLVGLQDFCISMAEKNNNYSAEYLDELIKNYLDKFLYKRF